MDSLYDAVIFDFDGTLADTAEGVFSSIRYACKKMKKDNPDDYSLRNFIGPPLLFSFKEYLGFSDEESEEAVSLYREYYSAEGLFKLRFYDGILIFAGKLRENGIKTGIASAKPDVFIQRIINHFKIADLFDYAKGISLEDYCTDKSYLFTRVSKNLNVEDMSRVLIIGDKCFDIDGAKAVGADSAGVTFGYGTAEELKASNAKFIVENTDELYKLVFKEN